MKRFGSHRHARQLWQVLHEQGIRLRFHDGMSPFLCRHQYTLHLSLTGLTL